MTLLYDNFFVHTDYLISPDKGKFFRARDKNMLPPPSGKNWNLSFKNLKTCISFKLIFYNYLITLKENIGSIVKYDKICCFSLTIFDKIANFQFENIKIFS